GKKRQSIEWQIANALCGFVIEAAKQEKGVAIACLPSEILCKANQLGLGAKVRIFCQESAAVSFLSKIES
ncbi:MAG: hypothetical protein AAB723_04095, partial [Patescibacteria group bacterium]